MNEELIIEKLKEIFIEKGYNGYDISENQIFSVWNKKDEKLRDGTINDIYVVSFWSKPLFGERKLIFANLVADTLDFLYMGGPSGYIEI